MTSEFFGYCRPFEMFSEEPPQMIEMSNAVARRVRLTEKGLARARAMCDGRISEVDWDVGESSHPIVVGEKFGFWTGRSDRVKTHDGNDVFYAQVQRRGAPIWGRFVRGRKPELSRHQTVVLRPVSDAGPVGWQVVAAYAGEPAPHLPGDPFGSYDRSLGFWLNHALVDGALPYDPATVTTKCPWL